MAAFLETRVSGSRRILNGVCPVDVTLSEAVQCGDLLGISGATWVRSAHDTTEQPLLIASVDAPSGDTIKGYAMAIVEVTNASGYVTTVGEQCSISDTGLYKVAAATEPDIGYSVSKSSDGLKSILFVFPLPAQLADTRS